MDVDDAWNVTVTVLYHGDNPAIISHLNALPFHTFADGNQIKLAVESIPLSPSSPEWNNIEIGAMLEFDRKPDIFRQDIHILMNALHL